MDERTSPTNAPNEASRLRPSGGDPARRLATARILRWIARAGSLLAVAGLLSTDTWPMLFRDLGDVPAIVILAVLLEGLALAWAWEFPGGLISLTAVGALLALQFDGIPSLWRRDADQFLVSLAFLAGPGVLFLLSAALRPAPDLDAPPGNPPPDAHRLKMAVLLATLLLPLCLFLRPKMSRITGCESSAIASLKTLVTAEEQYKSTSGTSVYTTLSALSATTPRYVDTRIRPARPATSSDSAIE